MGLRFVREVQKYLEFNLNYPNSFELIEQLIQLESCHVLHTFLQKLNYIFIPDILKKMHIPVLEKNVRSIFKRWAFEQL